jgi:hypothetical protein
MTPRFLIYASFLIGMGTSASAHEFTAGYCQRKMA